MSLIMMNMMLAMFLTTLTLKSPIIMTFNILMLALFTAWTYAFFLSSWYSFLIYLIYIGGMLIMFAYFVALSPNEHLKIKMYVITFIMTLITISIPSVFYKDFNIMLNSSQFKTSDLYFNFNIPMLWLMILLLLYIMLVITKMIYTSKGPLRPFM
uniref:NADH dehydrogenase subunit 6 n=1 Tax=Helobdella europaea TaxID=270691 RepID=UPI0023F380DE|nr:NADH dehydrogenase subunit 6 [Helobdella europaea]WDY83676.1 NADH dehydrogenase subunit 6 [Helobdella europaea]